MPDAGHASGPLMETALLFGAFRSLGGPDLFAHGNLALGEQVFLFLFDLLDPRPHHGRNHLAGFGKYRYVG